MRSRVVLLLMSVLFLDRPSAAAGLERLLERHRGKVLVLNFWATWCAPCRDEIPLLVRIQQQYGPKGVQVIGASIDDDLSPRLSVGIEYTPRRRASLPWPTCDSSTRARAGRR